MVDEVSILNLWKDRLNKFRHELQAGGWVFNGDDEIALEYSSQMTQSGTMPIESVSKMKEKDPTMRPAGITLRIKARLPLKPGEN